MKVKYFPDTDTAHVELMDGDVHETKEISENVYVDIDEGGNLVSMTIEHAKANAGLWEFSYQEMVPEIHGAPKKGGAPGAEGSPTA
jgi:uncharacterized protein YuzE